MRTIFRWEDGLYEFDALACYRGDSLIQLPDGRLLSPAGGWTDTEPPYPIRLAECGVFPEFGLVPTPARLIAKGRKYGRLGEWLRDQAEARHRRK